VSDAVVKKVSAFLAFIPCALCDARTPSFLASDEHGDEAAGMAARDAIQNGWACLKANGEYRFAAHWVCPRCVDDVRRAA
jgi:hypothetical protein